jgi:hypothetical protein
MRGQAGPVLTETVGGLRAECVASAGGTSTEIPYDDGMKAWQKAEQIALALLNTQYVYASGGYTRKLVDGDGPTPLSSVIDRVSLQMSASGFVETVDFTRERNYNAFVPEREFDRRLRERSLVPGEAEAKTIANQMRMMAQGLRSSPSHRRLLAEAFEGRLGAQVPLVSASVASGSGTLEAGTPLWRNPAQTQPALPASTTASHSVFCGVTTRSGEDASKAFKAQNTGEAMVRVRGPVTSGDRVAQVAGQDYVVAAAEAAEDAPEIGTACEDVDEGETKLIYVMLGGGGGTTVTGGGDARWA